MDGLRDPTPPLGVWCQDRIALTDLQLSECYLWWGESLTSFTVAEVTLKELENTGHGDDAGVVLPSGSSKLMTSRLQNFGGLLANTSLMTNGDMA